MGHGAGRPCNCSLPCQRDFLIHRIQLGKDYGAPSPLGQLSGHYPEPYGCWELDRDLSLLFRLEVSG